MELISVRLKYKPVPVYLLNQLSLVSEGGKEYMYICLNYFLPLLSLFLLSLSSFPLLSFKVVRLTEEPYSPPHTGLKNSIPVDRVKTWLIENKVLSIAFGGLYN